MTHGGNLKYVVATKICGFRTERASCRHSEAQNFEVVYTHIF